MVTDEVVLVTITWPCCARPFFENREEKYKI